MLRFLARESGFRWPITSGVKWTAPPMDALADTLSPAEARHSDEPLSTGGIEVRPWEVFEPDRILAQSGIGCCKGLGIYWWFSVFDRALRLLTKESFRHRRHQRPTGRTALLVTASSSQHSGFPFKDDYLEEAGRAGTGCLACQTLFHNALGAEDTELNRVAAVAFMVGAVRRTYEPGCPHDWLAGPSR